MHRDIERNRLHAPPRFTKTPASTRDARLDSSEGYTSQRPIQWSSWWWWWEISAAVLSLLSICLIITLLSNINDLPLSRWILPIQPNSILAVLTTVAKTSLLVPVTACIGQLKWRHFILQPRPLDQLQRFDNASRGPWGSAMLIYSFVFQVRSFVVLSLAAATLLALGVESSAQQIISFEPREIKVANGSVIATRAEAYASRTWNIYLAWNDKKWIKSYPGLRDYDEGDKSQQRTKLKATTYSSFSGSPPTPYYTCPEPATRCEWDDFSTLGICGRTRNVTDLVVQNCSSSYPHGPDGSCDFWHPFDDRRLANGSANIDPQNGDPITLGYNTDAVDTGRFTVFEFADLNTTASLKSIWIIKVNNPSASFDGHRFQHYESYTSDLYWCDRKLKNITASKSGFNAAQVQTTAWAGLDGSVAADGHSSLFDRNTHSTSTPSFPHFDFEEYPNVKFEEYTYNADGKPMYNISTPMLNRMKDAVNSIMGSGLMQMENRTWELLSRDGSETQAGVSTIAFELSDYMLTHDIETIIQNVADGMTAFMLEPNGDNAEVETVSGYMIYEETHIHIRWVWLLLPAFEALLACFLLALTIFVTNGQPLVKNSSIALLMYGLSDLDREDLIDKSEIATEERLERRAENMVAGLEREHSDSYRFIKYL
ncbi:hypothetical protein F5X98DRAFT_243630 [Xylaria grammica]|nr:hypothetical protein F5X98DRAFT_243630 [Xylaria grammica]